MTPHDPYDITLDEIVTISIVETNRTWRLSNFTYEDIHVFSYSISGYATCYWDGNERQICPGDLMHFPPKSVRTTFSSPQEPWKFLVMKFKMSARNQATQDLLFKSPIYLGELHGPVVDQMMRAETIWKGKQPGYIFSCKSLIYSILLQILVLQEQPKDAAHYSTFLAPVFSAIENNLQHSYSVPELARIANLSTSYFRTIFKRYTGYTPVEYLNYVKMSYARELLEMNLYSIAEVAEKVGISDSYYFSRVFKKVIGVPPSKILRLPS